MGMIHAQRNKTVLEPNRKIDALVMGLGTTGMSCVRHLVAAGLTVAVGDDFGNKKAEKRIQEEYPGIDIYIGDAIGEVLSRCDKMIVSPGIPLSNKWVRKAGKLDIDVTGDIEIFLNRINTPVLAVTGSNGKSTVVSLLTHLINSCGKEARLGGNIGIPVLDLLQESTPDYYVLELSSYQLEIIKSLNAVVAVVLNISQDHIERYKDIQDYANTKATIYDGDGTMVINIDDLFGNQFTQPERKSLGFTENAPEADQFGITTSEKERFLSFGDQALINVNELEIQGDHNFSNALAALAMGHAIDLPLPEMTTALKNFNNLPHRCQRVEVIDGIEWYNDSKGTNPAATIAAIKSLKDSGQIVLIAGGVCKNANFSELALVCKQYIHTTILIGQDSEYLAGSLTGSCDLVYSTSLESAVQVAHTITQPGGVVLLSPACASLDMFDNFEHRGEVFIKAVHDLVQEASL